MNASQDPQLTRLRRLLCAFLVAMAALAPEFSLARGPQNGVTPRPPRGRREVAAKGNRHFNHGGRFYGPARRGFGPVRAPRGAIRPARPAGFSVMVAGGLSCYTYQDVYYQQIPASYVVVAPPAEAEAPASLALVQPATAASGSVQVAAPTLNVHAGPGLSYPVIAVVYAGDVLTVQGAAPGWLYVLLPNNDYGWVAKQSTNMVAPPASG